MLGAGGVLAAAALGPTPPEAVKRTRSSIDDDPELRDIMDEVEAMYPDAPEDVLRDAVGRCEGNVDAALDAVMQYLSENPPEAKYAPAAAAAPAPTVPEQRQEEEAPVVEEDPLQVSEEVPAEPEEHILHELKTEEKEDHYLAVEVGSEKCQVLFHMIGDPPYNHLCLTAPFDRCGVLKAPLLVSFGEATPLSSIALSLASRLAGPGPEDIKLQYEGKELDLSQTLEGNSVPGMSGELKCASEEELKQTFGCRALHYTMREQFYTGRHPEQTDCPQCKRPFWTKAQFDDELKCGHCSATWNRSTIAAAAVIARACPNCGTMITRYHGHGCHHIAPGRGCPTCGQHFCYVCVRPHGPPGHFQYHPECKHRSSFCSVSDPGTNIIRKPFAFDKRCGCALCPICQPGKPCEQCGGNCIVCSGVLDEETLRCRRG